MRQLSMLENLNILKDISISNIFLLILIIIMIILIIIFSSTNRMNVKRKRKFYISFYVIGISLIIIKFFKYISPMFDYMMNNFFDVFFFPNLAVYLAGIISVNVILWITTLNGKESRIIKIINSIVWAIIHYIFVVFLITVNNDKLDVLSQSSIYTNEKTLAIIEISSIIFVSWIMFLVIYNLIKKVIYKKKGLSVEQITVYSKKIAEKTVDNKIRMVEPPYFVRMISKNKPKVSKKEMSKECLAYEKALTLEDYKLVLQILKEEKEKEKHSVVVIPQKSVESQNKVIDQPKLSTLRDLYKSIS